MEYTLATAGTLLHNRKKGCYPDSNCCNSYGVAHSLEQTPLTATRFRVQILAEITSASSEQNNAGCEGERCRNGKVYFKRRIATR